jgi:hypothetical protein
VDGVPPDPGALTEIDPVVSSPREEERRGDDQVDGEEKFRRREAPPWEENLTER